MSITPKYPKIGISLRIVEAENYDETRDALSYDWITLLEELNLMKLFSLLMAYPSPQFL